MNTLLWSAYLQDDLDKFRNLLANATHAPTHTLKSHAGGSIHNNNGLGFAAGSPGVGLGTSPRNTPKARGTKGANLNITKSDINSRDYVGLTLLHRSASSTNPNAVDYAQALLDHPLVDLYLQDYENGWTAFTRALYFGNIRIARAILQKDLTNGVRAGSLIKIKDNEGNSPFDVYNSTIARRVLGSTFQDSSSTGGESDDSDHNEETRESSASTGIGGDELYVFGSNKNFTLGLGDHDDRAHPERVILKRPDHLLYRFYNEYLQSKTASQESTESTLTRGIPSSIDEIPILIRSRPIVIQDVILSKFASAIITTDPESNMYACGWGKGGRLGTGDEQTRFEYVCIETGGLAGKKVVAVALGLNHSMAVSEEGELFSWGSNGYGQLGYTLPRQEDEQNVPRQLFGPLKREVVKYVAASDIHSVAYTSSGSLYTWGKNEGQLGLMDSDSRSLAVQSQPRKVAASLFSSPVQMVRAMNKATICLLESHAVCVFTSYGYSFVKFPMGETFSNYFSKNAALTTSYEAEPDHVISITSSGETIAAVSSRGDLFTLNINQKLDSSNLATSTTNPAKIRSAISKPSRIWSIRKGNWDGIKSVDVGENGTVIVNTNAGAVWHRVKRLKVKDAHTSSLVESKAKDYKFQRISNLTNIVAVKSNTFGGYAAIRKDSDVLKSQIKVEGQKLWDDIAPLLALRGLEASEIKDEDTETPRFWMPALPKEHFQPMKRAFLSSPDLEADVSRHLRNRGPVSPDYDIVVSTTVSEVTLPVHGFILTGRSSILQQAWSEYRKDGHALIPEVLEILPSQHGKANFRFHGVDFITLLNLINYIYSDTVVDVWQFTKHAPRLAFRYRTVRTELMKLASRLGLSKLEASVRYMTEPERQLHLDLDLAIQNPTFFEDGDAIVQLDGDEVRVHTAIMCRRCPFFHGLFNGRSGGLWLAARRVDESEPVKVDLEHIDPSTFQLVLRYIYSDVGAEIFDDIVAADLDEFCEIVMDVLSVADELMMDRLSQICQQVLGRFVNTRNVCNLLNAIAPYSCPEFKNAGLEYVCMQLECMLENRLLDYLDDDLISELDEVVKSNQLACMPFSKSGRAELLLHERNPRLAEDMDEERLRRIRDEAYRAHLREDDNRLSSSYRARFGSLDDITSPSPTQDRARRRSKAGRNAPFSPALHPKDSSADLMFDMEDEIGGLLEEHIPTRSKLSDWSKDKINSTPVPLTSAKSVVKGDISPIPSPQTPTGSLHSANDPSTQSAKPWSATMLSSTKLDMKDIMAQASSTRTSSLSIGFSAQMDKEKAAATASISKVSQKERKKQQQLAMQQATLQPRAKPSTDGTVSSPWQVQLGSKTSLKDVITSEAKNLPLTIPETKHSPVSHSSLNIRRTASPDTRFAGQARSSSIKKNLMTPPATSSKPSSQQPKTIVPHSKSYTAPVGNAEPSLLLSMSDIIVQQKREQDLIREAVAKRSLQEIQEEQAFQAWWDAESKKAQEEEAERLRNLAAAGAKKEKGGRSRGGRRGGDSAAAERGGGSSGRGRNRGRGRGGTQASSP